ncbi:hypothetical protein ACI8AF_18590 [Blastococcus sp. SYSU D00669]
MHPNAEGRQFDTLSRFLAADPHIAGILRAAERRERRQRFWRRQAPVFVAWRERRRYARFLAQGA